MQNTLRDNKFKDSKTNAIKMKPNCKFAWIQTSIQISIISGAIAVKRRANFDCMIFGLRKLAGGFLLFSYRLVLSLINCKPMRFHLNIYVDFVYGMDKDP